MKLKWHLSSVPVPAEVIAFRRLYKNPHDSQTHHVVLVRTFSGIKNPQVILTKRQAAQTSSLGSRAPLPSGRTVGR